MALLFAGTQGLLDDLPLDRLRAFETFFYDWLDREDASLLRDIRDTRSLSDGLGDALTEAARGAKADFVSVRPRQEREPYREDGRRELSGLPRRRHRRGARVRAT